MISLQTSSIRLRKVQGFVASSGLQRQTVRTKMLRTEDYYFLPVLLSEVAYASESSGFD